MAKQLNSKSEVPQNLTALYALIPKGMTELYAAEQKVASLTETYLKSAKDDVKKLKRTIKADTGLETVDFDNFIACTSGSSRRRPSKTTTATASSTPTASSSPR